MSLFIILERWNICFDCDTFLQINKKRSLSKQMVRENVEINRRKRNSIKASTLNSFEFIIQKLKSWFDECAIWFNEVQIGSFWSNQWELEFNLNFSLHLWSRFVSNKNYLKFSNYSKHHSNPFSMFNWCSQTPQKLHHHANITMNISWRSNKRFYAQPKNSKRTLNYSDFVFCCACGVEALFMQFLVEQQKKVDHFLCCLRAN